MCLLLLLLLLQICYISCKIERAFKYVLVFSFFYFSPLFKICDYMQLFLLLLFFVLPVSHRVFCTNFQCNFKWTERSNKVAWANAKTIAFLRLVHSSYWAAIQTPIAFITFWYAMVWDVKYITYHNWKYRGASILQRDEELSTSNTTFEDKNIRSALLHLRKREFHVGHLESFKRPHMAQRPKGWKSLQYRVDSR